MQKANSGSKWRIAAERTIAAPAEEVWDAISMRGNLELCHPFCAKNPVQVWPGEESHDEIHYLSGWVYERRFKRWIEGTGYDLEILQRDAVLATVCWRISRVDEKSCRLSITVYSRLLQNLPVMVRWLTFVLRLRPMLRKYLQSVVKGFEWYVTRGEPVPRNQFGKHPWFSDTVSGATRFQA